MLRYGIIVGRSYRSIWAQVFRFQYRYLYMSVGVVTDVCLECASPKKWICAPE